MSVQKSALSSGRESAKCLQLSVSSGANRTRHWVQADRSIAAAVHQEAYNWAAAEQRWVCGAVRAGGGNTPRGITGALSIDVNRVLNLSTFQLHACLQLPGLAQVQLQLLHAGLALGGSIGYAGTPPPLAFGCWAPIRPKCGALSSLAL